MDCDYYEQDEYNLRDDTNAGDGVMYLDNPALMMQDVLGRDRLTQSQVGMGNSKKQPSKTVIHRDKNYSMGDIQRFHPRKSENAQRFSFNCNEIQPNKGRSSNVSHIPTACSKLRLVEGTVGFYVCGEADPEVTHQRESDPLLVLHTLLKFYPSIGVVDIGFKSGAFSLLAACMNRTTVSVGASRHAVDSMVTSLAINQAPLQEYITVLYNIITTEKDNLNDKSPLHFSRASTAVDVNLTSIVMYNLLEVMPCPGSLLRLDIEYGEHLAFMDGGKDFLKEIIVPIVYIHWNKMATFYRTDVKRFVAFMESNKYEAVEIHLVNEVLEAEYLDTDHWRVWPHWVFWKLQAFGRYPMQ